MFSKMCKYFNKKKDPFPDPKIMGAMIFITNWQEKNVWSLAE